MCSLNNAIRMYQEEPEKCTHCGLDYYIESNPLIYVDDEKPELVCLICIEHEGRTF
jgi:hypothetical protein